ncbi:unnamed protein product [Closterium sp. NIES-65]|nr:unnamed protein product [Closterium sp. NIES-65]
MADLASLGGVSAAVGSEARSLFSHSLERAKNRSADEKTDPKDSGLVQYADDEEDRNEEDDEEGDEIRVSGRRGHLEVRRECPYLDTVNRQLLDFDFEKFCSVSLSNLNVYGCLVCGKYFQGRARSSHAVTHSVDAGHHVFINLHSEKVYCLPDGYQVSDPSLDDIKSVLNPRFTAAQIEQFDRSKQWARALDGTDYIPGMVGLNNIKDTGYVNVIIQSLMRVTPLRNFFLLPANYTPASHSPAAQPTALVRRFGELVRKVWHPRNFKGQVSPHEFLQAIMLASKKRFLIGQQSDPLDLLSWLLNTLHADLAKSAAAAAKAAGKKAHHISSIIQECFQGELEVTKEVAGKSSCVEDGKKRKREGEEGKEGEGEGEKEEDGVKREVSRMPFLMLGLDLPPPPLFKDVMEKNIIPQVPLFNILKKFDGQTVTEVVRPHPARMRYRITRLPRYLILHMKRFKKNNFFIEKNPTLVNFPVKNLELKDYLPLEGLEGGGKLRSKYDLIANVVHDGKPGEGSYRAFVQRKAEEAWYEMQDLHVTETLPQMVALSEAYIQIYEQQWD